MNCSNRNGRNCGGRNPGACANRPSENCRPAEKKHKPFFINVEQEAMKNTAFRVTPWTGEHMQMTLMCIPPGGEIGLECHPKVDQFICIVEGQGVVKMGDCKNNLSSECVVSRGCAFFIPACTWHNLINTGRCPIKLYSLYAPPQHPPGTVHQTKRDADKAEHD